jgi:signal transduction histidine kinase
LRRLISLFVLTTLLAVSVAGAALVAATSGDSQRAIEREARDLANFSAVLVGRELVANRRSVQMMAQSPAFDGGFDSRRFLLLSKRLLLDQPTWRAISVAVPGGARVLDWPQPIAGRTGGRVVEMPSFQEAVRTGQPQIGDIAIGPKGRPAFAVRAPVLRNGQLTHIVSAVVDANALGRMLLPPDVPAGWSVWIVDRSGRLVADPAGSLSPASLIPPELRAQVADTEGRLSPVGAGKARQVGLAAAVPESTWRVYVSLPAQLYERPRHRAYLGLALALTAAVVAAIALGRLLRRELAFQRKTELAAFENQRLEALGRMTGGVAHDFNNLLTPILGGLDLLQRRLPDDPRTARILDGALTSAERARALVVRLLSFARRQALEPRPTDVRLLLAGLVDLLESSVGGDVSVRLELEDASLFVEADPHQLELAVLNLAVNARDAMPEGGELVVSADEMVAKSGTQLKAGRYIRIAVTDTGGGMDEATLRKAIEPFFTTKGIGQGTGLGLSMVHGMAAQLGGALILESTLGQGTTAEIWLPAGAPTPQAQEIVAASPAERLGRVLLVDDDDLVREATAEVLRDHGHAVLQAASAAVALRLIRTEPAFDLVVTDYFMPGRTGADLIRDLRALDRPPPILLITGYSPERADIPDDVPRLAKPFRRTELLHRVSELLPATPLVAPTV